MSPNAQMTQEDRIKLLKIKIHEGTKMKKNTENPDQAKKIGYLVDGYIESLNKLVSEPEPEPEPQPEPDSQPKVKNLDSV